MHQSKSLPFVPVPTGNLTLKRDIKVYMFKPDDFVRDQPGDSGLYYYMVDGMYIYMFPKKVSMYVSRPSHIMRINTVHIKALGDWLINLLWKNSNSFQY